MRCPSCGAIIKKRTMKCPECGAFRNRTWVESKPEAPVSVQSVAITPAIESKPPISAPNPSLITFPGVTRTTVPNWRHELGERVREVQERRAREAALESTQTQEEAKAAPMLELIPAVESEPVNPIVLAALQRIQRAHAQPQFSGNAAIATCVDYQEEPQLAVGLASPYTEIDTLPVSEANVRDDSPPLERVHNLSVVPSPVQQEEVRQPAQPKRLIRDDAHDPALNYLDSVQTATIVDTSKHSSAPIAFRILSGITDLIGVALLSTPILALVKLSELSWEDPRVIAFAAGTILVVGFIYFTVITAFSGRTLGMRLFSLRVVDARTGLIPTGTQSAGRSLVFMLSLAAAGIALIYTLIDRDRRAVHDRFTRTAVVRV